MRAHAVPEVTAIYNPGADTPTIYPTTTTCGRPALATVRRISLHANRTKGRGLPPICVSWSGWWDLNPRPRDPKSRALPSCATPRQPTYSWPRFAPLEYCLYLFQPSLMNSFMILSCSFSFWRLLLTALILFLYPAYRSQELWQRLVSVTHRSVQFIHGD